MSIPQASVSSGTAPSEEIASTTSRASPTSSLIARTSEMTPVEVSDCWQKTISVPASRTAAPTSAGSGVSPHAYRIACTSRPWWSQIAIHRSPNEPWLTTDTRSPGTQRFATADSIAPVPEAANRSTSEDVQ
jgi:hypothetical protein